MGNDEAWAEGTECTKEFMGGQEWHTKLVGTRKGKGLWAMCMCTVVISEGSLPVRVHIDHMTKGGFPFFDLARVSKWNRDCCVV